MDSVRTILWIGSAAALRESPMADAPSFDLVWSPTPEAALDRPLADFHAVVMDAGDEAHLHEAALRERGARQVLVTSDPSRYPTLRDLMVRPKTEPAALARLDGIIGESPAMRRTFSLVVHARASQATALLTGETGTGKEVLARAIHQGSPRAAAAFVAVNCAAFPDTLLESELFGHVRGAFTGADRSKEGLFSLADGGTLFLDEIGETTLPLQAKLLRALQEREVRPVGGTRARRVDVRVVAATNRDLRAAVATARFRDDLFYRLAVFPIPVPPLRERVEDILPLASHFLEVHGKRENRPDCTLSADAQHLLLAHRWPGNVRELENEIQRALALSEPGDTIPVERLSERVGALVGPETFGHEPRGDEPLRDTLARYEAWVLRRALERHHRHRSETARSLGITREGLYKKMKRLGIG